MAVAAGQHDALLTMPQSQFPMTRMKKLTDPHPPIVPAAFSKLDTVAVLTARLFPTPDAF
jgi:hypothetical protein